MTRHKSMFSYCGFGNLGGENSHKAIVALSQQGEPASFRIPIIRALQEGRLDFLDHLAPTNSRIARYFVAINNATGLPGVAIIADDIPNPRGPRRVPGLVRLMRWSRGIIILGHAGEIGNYSALVPVAEEYRRILLVECSPELVAAYAAATAKWAPHAQLHIVPEPTEPSRMPWPVLTTGGLN
jgi:hypothetical protein